MRNACQSPTDSAIASCESTIETGVWGFTRTGDACSGTNECPDHTSPECATADLEFDSDDGGTFHVTSTANGVFHPALPAGNYQACCKDTTGQVSTCQSGLLREPIEGNRASGA